MRERGRDEGVRVGAPKRVSLVMAAIKSFQSEVQCVS